ncbi:hypothetical protein C8Q77DRAFT_1218912 [Trametes polyzona]|nr:hypothetical protein C8Q77DRAFT_1218912 [Trametes polyzona]
MPHPALQNQDILLEILRQARGSVGNQAQAGYDTIATAARVNKAFCEPALQILWEHLPSILPLLRLLSPSFRSINGGHEASETRGVRRYDAYVLHDIPNAQQWAIFCRYAQRVRVLHYDDPAPKPPVEQRFGRTSLDYATIQVSDSESDGESDEDTASSDPSDTGSEIGSTIDTNEAPGEDDGPSAIADDDPEYQPHSEEVDSASEPRADPQPEVTSARSRNPTYIFPSVWYHFRRLSQGKPLLPTLRELRWTTGPDQTEIFLFVGPSLERLHLHFHPMHRFTDNEYDATLPLLMRSIFARHASSLRSVVSQIRQMNKLRSLAIDPAPATGRAMTAARLLSARLETFENLESLTISLRVTVHEWDASPITLPSLRTLVVADYAGNPEAYKLFDAPGIHTLDVTLRLRELTTTATRAICSAIARKFPGVSSLTFAIRSPSSRRPPNDVASSPLGVMQPLLGLTRVRSFSLATDRTLPVAIGSSGLRPLLESWPDLTSLSIDLGFLHASPYVVSNVLPNPSVLVDVARTRTRLEKLFLSDLRLDWLVPAHARSLPSIGTEEAPLRCASMRVLAFGIMRNLSERVVPGLRRSREARLEACAAYVHRLYPNLDLARCRAESGALDEGEVSVWGRVLDIVVQLRAQKVD